MFKLTLQQVNNVVALKASTSVVFVNGGVTLILLKST